MAKSSLLGMKAQAAATRGSQQAIAVVSNPRATKHPCIHIILINITEYIDREKETICFLIGGLGNRGR